MSEYFPEPKSLGKVEVELHLCRIMQRKEISIIRQELIYHLLLKQFI